MTRRRDGGLGPERTRLAWRRTFLTLTVVALLCARLAIQRGSGALGPLAAAAAMLVWLVALIATFRRMRAIPASASRTAGRALLISAGTGIGYAVIGAILVLSHIAG